MYLKTGLYGLKNFAIINALCTGFTSDVVFVSTSGKSQDQDFADGDLGETILAFDNEVYIDAWMENSSQGRRKLTRNLTKLVKLLERKFTEDDEIYFLSRWSFVLNKDAPQRYKVEAKELLAPVTGERSLMHIRLVEWLYPRIKAMPLKLADFRATLESLKSKMPDISLQTTNPFLIERRKELLVEMHNNITGFKEQILLGPSSLLAKCLLPGGLEVVRQDYEKLFKYDIYFKDEETLHEVLLSDPMLEPLVKTALLLREDENWIDPILIVQKFDEYRPLIGFIDNY